MEIQYRQNGIYLPEIDLWLDNTEPCGATWISHGHSDHARGCHGKVLGTPATLEFYRMRLYLQPQQEEPVPIELAYGESLAWNGARLTAYPAAHILGAAQLLIEYRKERVVYTGDMKLKEPLCGVPTEVVPCDRLIIESTFGLPIFKLLSREEGAHRIVQFARECLADNITPVFIGYSLGRGQEIAHVLTRAGIRTAVHGAIAKFLPVYERYGYAFPGWEPYEAKAAHDKALVVVPSHGIALAAGRKKVRIAYVSGWAALDNARNRSGAEELIPYSDHGDFDELLAVVTQSRSYAGGRGSRVHDALCAHSCAARHRGFSASESSSACRRGRLVDQFAAACEEIARHSGKLEKARILADYLKCLSDEDLRLAVQFLSSGPRAPAARNHTLFGVAEPVKLAVGYGVLRDALREATGWDSETLSACHTTVGDTGETIGLLMRGLSKEQPLSLREASAIYDELFLASSGVQKRARLVEAFLRFQPATIKFFVKVMTRSLRIGLLEKTVEDAVALACAVPSAAVRDANNRLGDLAEVAMAARHGRLESIEARLFHPVEFMLANPLDRVEDLADPAEWIIEDKYDGIRSQLHFDSGRVRIFSRGLEDITSAFPEIEQAFAKAEGNGLIDGELLAWREDRPLNFNMLQQRIARKRVTAALQRDIPVVFIAYDVLLSNSELLLGRPIEDRLAVLRQTLKTQGRPILISTEWQAATPAGIETLFEQAKARGNEGLLLKRRGSIYEPGMRGGSWLKLKRPYATLDVVITAAEPGQGRRAIYLSDYTFAVRSAEGFVNVGKAYSGLTDSEIKELTRLLRAGSIDKFGRVFLVKPEVVLEVAFDGVQKSPRHKSGYALRFPRILRWRRDKTAEECDELARVEQLYQASIR